MDDEGNPRLADFGRSKLVDRRGFTTAFAGSARYLAPELTAEELGEGMTTKTDVFAFAMLALEVSNPLSAEGFPSALGSTVRGDCMQTIVMKSI